MPPSRAALPMRGRSGLARTRGSSTSVPWPRSNRPSWPLPVKWSVSDWTNTRLWWAIWARIRCPASVSRGAVPVHRVVLLWPRAVALGRRGGGHPGHGRRQVRVQRIDGRTAEAGEAEGFYADYNADVDRKVFAAVFPLHGRHARGLRPGGGQSVDRGSRCPAIAEEISRSILDDGEAFMALLREGNRKALKKESGDAVLRWAKETSDSYWVQVRGEYGKRMGALDDDMGRYLRGLQEVYPDSTFWPDANSTFMTFGRMEASPAMP